MRVTHIKNHVDEQTSRMEFIASAVTNLTRIGVSNVSSQRIETRRSALIEQWNQFSLTHDAIKLALRLISSRDKDYIYRLPYFREKLFSATQEGYFEALETMDTMLARLRKDTRSPSIQSNSQASTFPSNFNFGPRLPNLTLPNFDGSPSDWLQFKDLFDSMVLSNANLTPVWKLHYLKQSLTGTAAHLLKNTALTSDNFQKAWDSLVAFYENKRLLVNSALHSLFAIKRINKESSAELENLYTTVTQICRSLETLGRPVESWDNILVFSTVRKLDPESIKEWEHHLGSSQEPPSWKKFLDYLLTRLLTLKAVEKSRKTPGSSHQQPVKAHLTSDGSSTVNKCSICTAEHYVARCPEYQNKSVNDRLELIKKHSLCYNCLGQHRSNDCRSTRRCIKCGKKHHTTTHRQEDPVKSTVSQVSENCDSSSEESIQANCASVNQNSSPSKTILATIQLIVVSDNGEKLKVRALVDPGSQISFISENLVQNLKLPRQHSSVPLIGIGAVKAGRTRGLVCIRLIPYFDSQAELKMTTYILPKLTSRFPSTKMSTDKWKHLADLQLADPNINSASEIDIIIGADYYGSILEEGLRRGPPNSPTAQATIFGWILFGPSDPSPLVTETQNYHVSIDEQLYELFQKFCKLDEIPTSSTSSRSKEDQECEDHFKSTHTRNADGKYVVRIPLKKPISMLGDSRKIAIQMLFRLINRIKINSQLKIAYCDFLKNYEVLKHMLLILSHNNGKGIFYLPHHGIIRESSITTKLRVVFNGSKPTSTGVSLNDIVHTGEKLQSDIINVLLWFRQFRYVFTSDIEKMYRQIEVHPDDRDLQRIVWIDDSNNIIEYQLATVTYGLACAPFLALRTMQQLVEDEGARFPLAVPTMINGRYVDDNFGGAHSIPEAQEVVQQVDEMCMAGGFPLQKWTSNEPIILENLPPEKKLLETSKPIDQTTLIHTLGMNWNPSTDTFHFTFTKPSLSEVTKRTVLSTIAKLYDPLGLLAPIVITAKLFIQDLWTIKLDWDDQLPPQLVEKWSLFIHQLETINTISFPRWLGITASTTLEIHAFCDASQFALAAAVYLRASESDGQIQTALVCAKTKVAPIKRLTIPRLELSAAVLGSKLVHHIQKVLNLETTPIHLWTDSAITHTWINNHPSRWKDFIHNRVCLIQETLPSAKWHFISGKENPADYATRGFTPSQLSDNSAWWIGPEWLQQPSESWPINLSVPEITENLEERQVSTNISISPANNSTNESSFNLLKKYSDLNKLIRITALCKRFILILQKKAESVSQTPLKVEELDAAKKFWAQSEQQVTFRKEIASLINGESLGSSHYLARLTPFVDSQGLMRVGGRLKSSFLSFDQKHPIILPRNSRLSQLIISDAHQRTLHGGTQKTHSLIRSQFWIIGGRSPVNTIIWNCVTCVRHRKLRSQQLMGQLPAERVTPSRPFLHSGVDYAGPLLLKTWKGRAARTYKAYIALFICESTSAIHLELVTDYSSDAFIAAYKRFTSRSGICATLRSDCGTTLTGADKELKALFSSASKELGILSSLLAKDGTQWSFNPPAAPHFGGHWEAGVRSVKHHLRRVIGDHLLTYEELTTFLSQVEAVLNSRPISPLTEDPNDLNALTPGHFLIGGPLNIIPEPNLESIKTARLSRWQLLRQMLDSFWTRWSKECLQRYQTTCKWNQSTNSIKLGSLVLVIDERYPPSKWPLGRILETHPGKDGLSRVFTVKTQNTVLKRPITKLCLLPIKVDSL